MNPLKQGLKREKCECSHDSSLGSLSMNPLKQGLKQRIELQCGAMASVFIHESIKTRVETGQDFQDTH